VHLFVLCKVTDFETYYFASSTFNRQAEAGSKWYGEADLLAFPPPSIGRQRPEVNGMVTDLLALSLVFLQNDCWCRIEMEGNWLLGGSS
jgi:hypothetical protein